MKRDDDTDHGISSSLLVHSSLHLGDNSDSHETFENDHNIDSEKPKNIEKLTSSQMEQETSSKSYDIHSEGKSSMPGSNEKQEIKEKELFSNKENCENQSIIDQTSDHFSQFGNFIYIFFI